MSEEDGGLGAFATLLRGHTGDCAIIPEPTSGKVVVANAGALTFRLTVHGRAAHGSVRHEGVSAVEALYPLLRAIDELEARRNRNGDALFAGTAVPYPISIGTVHAGDWPSSVPDLLVAEGRMGVVIDEDPAEAQAPARGGGGRRRRARSVAARQPAAVEWVGGQFASGRLPPRTRCSARCRLPRSTREVGPASRPSPGAGPWGSDLRLYTGIGGIAALHYGPGDVKHAHAPREQVAISDVTHIARTLALVAMRRCGVRGIGRRTSRMRRPRSVDDARSADVSPPGRGVHHRHVHRTRHTAGDHHPGAVAHLSEHSLDPKESRPWTRDLVLLLPRRGDLLRDRRDRRRVEVRRTHAPRRQAGARADPARARAASSRSMWTAGVLAW